MSNYVLGTRGASLIKSYEQLRLTSYLPTPNDKWTIGWGHTKGVLPNMSCTILEAEKWFIEDTSASVNHVRRFASQHSIPLTQSMFDALVSLAFNVGTGSIKSSGSSIGTALVKRDYYAACQALFLWRKQTNRATGRAEDLLGLARRRAQEMVLFLEDGIPK